MPSLLSPAGAFSPDSLSRPQSCRPTRDRQQRAEPPVHADGFSHTRPPSAWAGCPRPAPLGHGPQSRQATLDVPSQKGAKGPGLSARTPLPTLPRFV